MDVPEAPQPTTAVIVAGGDPVDGRVVDRLPPSRWVIAADSGLDDALRLGLAADVVVGDLDSVSRSSLAQAAGAGIPIHRHPVDKDATDLELALLHAVDAGFRNAILIGGAGGRLSHLLGNALAITSERYRSLRIEWHVGPATVFVVRSGHDAGIVGSRGDLVSLVPIGGAASGVTTTGLQWSLADATLDPGSTRGISNTMTGTHATVNADGGVVLAIHEGKL